MSATEISTSRTRRRPRPLVDAVVLTACVGLATLPLLPVYGGTAIVAPVLGGLLVGGGIALVAALRRWGVMVTVAVTVVGYVLVGPALAVPDAVTNGVVPTVDAVRTLLAGAFGVWKDVLTLDPSLGRSGGVLVAPFLLALLGSSIAVGVATRTWNGRTGTGPAGPAHSGAERAARGAWAGVVPFVVLGVAVLLGGKTTVWPVPAGVVTALALLVWAAWRRGSLAPRRVVALVLLGGLAAGAGVVAGPVVADQNPRYVLRDELVPPFDPSAQASPLSAFRKFVKDWPETDLLSVRGLPEGARVRLATLDAFDGVVWNVAGAQVAEGSGEFRRLGDTIDTSVRGRRTTVEIEVHHLPMVWLPTVGYAEGFDFTGPGAGDLAEKLRYNDATGTAVLTDGVPDGARWTEQVVLPVQPDDDDIAGADAASVRLPEPQGVPDAIPMFAGDLAGTATTPLLIARSLEQGLADRGWFSHGLVDSGDQPSLSGHGADRLTTLLTGDLMIGDGEQYASAMALMARQMGLPARVVLGFTVGDPAAEGELEGDGRDPGEEITFTGEDIGAWVEVAFAGHGWVTFDPTPPETKTPSDETPVDRSDPRPQVVQPPPPPEDPVRPPDDDTEQPRTEDTEAELPTSTDWTTVALVAGTVAVPLLLIVLPFVLIVGAKARRRRRRRHTGPPVARVVGGWDEVLDAARDLRRPVPARATRREAAVHLSRAFASARSRGGAVRDDHSRRAVRVGAPVAALAAGADELVFGPGEPDPAQVEAYWQQVEESLAVMTSSVSTTERLRARWSVRSLRARRRARRAARGDSA